MNCHRRFLSWPGCITISLASDKALLSTTKQRLKIRDTCCDSECHGPIALYVNCGKYSGNTSATRLAGCNSDDTDGV